MYFSTSTCFKRQALIIRRDDERLSLETCTGGKINTLKKVKKVRQAG
jgi:hypothetical protein